MKYIILFLFMISCGDKRAERFTIISSRGYVYKTNYYNEDSVSIIFIDERIGYVRLKGDYDIYYK